ncbi:MAG: hypothetical protein AAFN10_27475, partial [Bacteroidota bacterium]
MFARWSILFVLLGSLGFPTLCLATDTLQLRFDNENYLLEPRYLEVLGDPENRLTIEDITSPVYSEQFSLTNQAFPHPEDLDASHWIR